MININDSEVKVLKSSVKWEKKSREEICDETFTQILSRLSEEDRVSMLYYCLVNDTLTKPKTRKPKTHTKEQDNISKS